MKSIRGATTLLLFACLAPALRAQHFSVAGRKVELHGFVSQGFAYSNHNNYLTMKTSEGSFAFTDGGVNLSSQITDRFRVGAQVYARNVGNLGQGKINLDWAFGDYRFADWFGIRAGKVKTVMGLYNDTQDMDFLQTFALLPQAVYSLDMREATIAHEGVDAYGRIGLKRFGNVDYTLYAGHRRDSLYGGYPYMVRSLATIEIDKYGGNQWGGDLRWHTGFDGLLMGVSHMNADIRGTGTGPINPANRAEGRGPFEEHADKDQTSQLYSQFSKGNLRVEYEYRRYWRDQAVYNGTRKSVTDMRGWYTAAAYRVHKKLELGSYYSRFILKSKGSPSSPPGDYPLFDKVVTARLDVTSRWNVKVEGHFMKGTGARNYPNGFYAIDNPQGFKPDTNLLIVRTGFNW